MSVAPPHVCRRSGQNAGGTAEEERSSPCLFLFQPLFSRDPEACVDDRTPVVRSRMTVPMSLFSGSSLPACVLPFMCSVWSSKGSGALYPFNTSSHLPFIVLCPCAENPTLGGFPACCLESAPISPGLSMCCPGLLFSLTNSVLQLPGLYQGKD